MLDLGLPTLTVLCLAVVVGTLVQTTVGLGLGLVAAPVTALVAPSLMPGTMLLIVSVLPLMTLSREHADIDWRGLGWSFPTRLLGTVVGVVVVARVDDRQLGVLIGAMVLAAVLLTWRAVTPPVNRGTLATAGFVSGITGTASSIGGPPMALLYARRDPRQIRTTLAVYFLVGASMSLLGLALAGELTWLQAEVALLMVPLLLLGAETSRLLRHRLRPSLVRPAVLVVCGASAGALLVRSLLG
ncbi:sulfite exporter TauE/SafE family protein [Nocardioides aequoreus]|uniref:sulfite exporter TauE/SafE family protein n=1 Tax=Nocardioides aequoreus TaxID=397278 RepID=UPI0004C2FD31|nr:sulfite exporter TauE/SafE family protein [Nocardioides aequoreus]